jgi:hypothetical protein
VAAGSGSGAANWPEEAAGEEVVAALHALLARTATQVFTVPDVYTVQLDRAEPNGFRVVDA